MRILFVDSGVGFAGGQTGLVGILKNLDQARFEPVVASPAASVLAERCRRAGWDWHALPFASRGLGGQSGAPSGRITGLGWLGRLGRLGDWAASLYGIAYLAALVMRLRIDLVHANTFKAALVCGFACAVSGRPMVFHDRTEITHGLWGRLVDHLARRVIVISQAVGAKRGARAAAKMRLVYDGVDGAGMKARSAAPEMVVGYLGRINEEKGLDLLVESAAAVLAERPRARFVIGGAPFTMGDLAYYQDTMRRVLDLGLDRAFRFAGAVADARSFLEGVSLLVMPSRREGLGIVALEAMALERPVVAFRTGGIGEVVCDGRTGVLASPGDVAGLARAVIGLLDDPAAARQMGICGRQRVLEMFTSKAMADNICSIYLDIAPTRAGEG